MFIFIVALSVLVCRCLESVGGVLPQRYEDNFKCVSSHPDSSLAAARFTSRCVTAVGQAAAPSKCDLLNTSSQVRRDMSTWFISDEGERWRVPLDVWDLGGHTDTSYLGRADTLASRISQELTRNPAVHALPLGFRGKLQVLRARRHIRLAALLSSFCICPCGLVG